MCTSARRRAAGDRHGGGTTVHFFDNSPAPAVVEMSTFITNGRFVTTTPSCRNDCLTSSIKLVISLSTGFERNPTFFVRNNLHEPPTPVLTAGPVDSDYRARTDAARYHSYRPSSLSRYRRIRLARESNDFVCGKTPGNSCARILPLVLLFFLLFPGVISSRLGNRPLVHSCLYTGIADHGRFPI